MTLRPWMLGLAGSTLSVLAPLAAAQVTPALDRVPPDALVAGTFKNLARFHAQADSLAKALKLPADALMGLTKAGDVLKTQGVNADASAAIALMPGDMEGEQGPVVIVVPVRDYAAFVSGLGGTPGNGVTEVQIEGEDFYVKNLGDGFAAAGPVQDVVTAFAGKAGGARAFEQMAGATGKAVMESADAYIVLNIPALAPKIQDGYAEAKTNMQGMLMMMGGAGPQPNFEAMDAMMAGFLRDCKSTIIGLGLGEAGVSLELASQFKEASPTAGYFSGPGNAGRILESLPNMPFMLAFAADTSAPGLKQAFKDLSAMGQKQSPLGNINPMQALEKADGMGFFWGTSPALMGGLFLNASMLVLSKDPASQTGIMKQAFEEMNGKTIEGTKYEAAYKAGGAKVGDKTVDTWSMRMQADPTNPMAQQMAQAQMMLFGPSGLQGYAAPVNGGIVMTYSKNDDLLNKAMEAANNRGGMGSNPGVQAVAGRMPKGQSIAGYIGIGSILETVVGFMGMMGGGPANFQVPGDLPPIGLGVVTNTGGLRGTVFVPTQVIQTFKALGDAFGGAGDEEIDEMNDESTGQPKF